MNRNHKRIKQMLEKLNAKGYVPSVRKGNTGIGATFEHMLKIPENNIPGADYGGYELKAQRVASASFTTLFTCSPDFPLRGNQYLKDNYGVPYEEFPEYKRLHISMFASRFTDTYSGYSFKLINDREAKQIRIGVYNKQTHELLDDSVGYEYSTIESCVRFKIQGLVHVKAASKDVDGWEHFKYNAADVYDEPSFEKFLNLIDEGKIMYDIRISIYKTKEKFGKTHDRGSGFRIRARDLELLFGNHVYLDLDSKR